MLEELYTQAFWVGLLKIIGVNIVLSGDNAVVIALAARSLPPKQQDVLRLKFLGELSYREIAEIFSQRVIVVDGTAKPEALAEEIHGHLRDLP